MLAIINVVRRTIEGSVLAIILLGGAALLGWSETINVLVADRSLAAIAFLLMLAVVLADLIAKIFMILGRTFPDLIPKLEDADVKRASLIKRLRPGQTMALLSGAYAARVVLFVVIFAALGSSYAAAPENAQSILFGDFTAAKAAELFLREGIAGSIGYFLFFLGPDRLAPITELIASERLVASTSDGDVFLAGIRLYGLAFVLAILRTLATPVTYIRARIRSRFLETD